MKSFKESIQISPGRSCQPQKFSGKLHVMFSLSFAQFGVKEQTQRSALQCPCGSNHPSEAKTFHDTIVTFFRFIEGQTSPLQEIQELKQEAAIAQLCHWKIVELRWCQECVSAGCLQFLSTMINCLHTRLSSVAQDDSSPAARSQHRCRHPFFTFIRFTAERSCLRVRDDWKLLSQTPEASRSKMVSASTSASS